MGYRGSAGEIDGAGQRFPLAKGGFTEADDPTSRAIRPWLMVADDIVGFVRMLQHALFFGLTLSKQQTHAGNTGVPTDLPAPRRPASPWMPAGHVGGRP